MTPGDQHHTLARRAEHLIAAAARLTNGGSGSAGVAEALLQALLMLAIYQPDPRKSMSEYLARAKTMLDTIESQSSCIEVFS